MLLMKIKEYAEDKNKTASPLDFTTALMPSVEVLIANGQSLKRVICASKLFIIYTT